MPFIMNTNSSSTVTPVLTTVSHISFISPPLSKFNVETSTAVPIIGDNDQLPTSINSILYNISMNQDYDESGELSNTVVNEFLNHHIKLSNIPHVTTSVSPIVPNVTESDSYLTIRNVSSLSCLNHIPPVHEYLAGKILFLYHSLFKI